jgi:hypothetical protein
MGVVVHKKTTVQRFYDSTVLKQIITTLLKKCNLTEDYR